MDMRTVGRLIGSRRAALGMTLQQLADASGCGKGYLSEIENGRRPGPPSERILQNLEAALLLEPGTLVKAARWQSTPAQVRREVQGMRRAGRIARELVELVKDGGLDEAHRSGSLQRLVERLAPAANIERTPLPVQVPVINSVAAGYPREFTDLGYPARVADDYVAAPDLMDPEAFAARVVGDSMAPLYAEGDIVVFSPERDTAPGSDCFVRLERDGETTFKRVYFEVDEESGAELIRLQPLNSEYPARTVGREDVAGMYAAVYVIRAVGAGGK